VEKWGNGGRRSLISSATVYAEAYGENTGKVRVKRGKA